MDPEYGARYRYLYEKHWWWRAREAFIEDLLRRWAPPRGFGKILDVGCGDGLFFPRLRLFGEPEGVEVEADLVSEAGRARGPIHVGPFDGSFEPRHPFGLITLLDVIEHLDDDVAALRRAADLLAPGGYLVITVPAFPCLWTAHDEHNQHRRRYTRASFERQARAAGVEVLYRHYFFHWLFPLKLLVRGAQWLRSGEPEMPEVPAPRLNRMLLAVCDLEQRTWGHLPWPFGTSLVAICRRIP